MIVPFFIPHLGCPHRCVFCDQEKIAGAPGILPGAEEIVARIRRFSAASPGGQVEVAFFGGTFTSLPFSDQKRLLDPLQPLIAAKEVSGVRISTRPDAIAASTPSFLKGLGVHTVELGVQSMDDGVLTLSGRGHDAACVERAFGLLQQEGVAVGAQLMPGLPGDSETRSVASVERILRLGPACLRIYPALVLAGTELADRYARGDYRPLSLEAAVTVSKKMLLAALRRGVPVLRIGLQPTAELESAGVVAAGPYHPAFGQLVASELYFDALCRVMEEIPAGSRVELCCHPGRVSDLVGQKRRNLARVGERFGVEVGSVREDKRLDRTAISLTFGEKTRGFDLLDL